MPKKTKNSSPEPRSHGRKVIGGIRSKLSAMNGTQLKAFYQGFTARELERHEQALADVREARVEEEIAMATQKIEALKNKIRDLKGE
ncbi:MAG: hypothetical protein NE328_15655 [Lentisphaeraceae bacterium]|nr:hypothetical protein [Lentisphaeraceae bacterium]